MRPLLLPLLVMPACEGPGSHTDDPWNSGPNAHDRVPQAPPCAKWLECVAATEPDRVDEEEAAYGPEGTCWVDEDQAADCATECRDALEDAFMKYPHEPACDTGKHYPPEAVLTPDAPWVLEGVELDDSCAEFPGSKLYHAIGRMTLTSGDQFRFDFDEALVWGAGGMYYDEGGGYALCEFDFPDFTCEGSLDGPIGFGYEWAMTMQGSFEPPFDTLIGRMQIHIEQKCWIDTMIVGYIP